MNSDFGIYKGFAAELTVDQKIYKSITRLYRAGKPITAIAVGMYAGICPSDVSRWFRDHGIFWDVWRKEWICVIPELAVSVLAELPRDAIPRASWLSTGWLRRGYSPGVVR